MIWAVVDRPQGLVRHEEDDWEDWRGTIAINEAGLDHDPTIRDVTYASVLGSIGGDAKTTRRGRNYQVLVDACELLIKRLEAA